jgi:hypothetical protein
MPSTRIKKRPAQAASLLKHFLAILAVMIVAGCSGGGCGGGGCSSCGGVTALPNGFTPAKRIENAGSVRLTQGGLGFLQSNLGTLAKQLIGGTGPNGLLTFNIPASTGSASGFDYSVCPGGPDPSANPPKCVAEIDVGSANLAITPAGPYDLHITGTLPLRMRNLPLHVQGLCVLGFCAVNSDITATLNGDGACPGGAYDQFPVNVDIQIHVDTATTHTARFGYSQIKVNQVLDSTSNDNIKNHVNLCGGFLGSLLDAVKGLFIGSLTGGLTSTLTSQIDSALCQKATATAPCPAGTTPDGSQMCRYPDNTCASTLLGTDGHIDLGGLLASVSPGTTGGLDFLFAAGGSDKNTSTYVPAASNIAWGDLAPVNGGATLGMFGGAEPNPLSKCVKLADLTLPTGIPIPDELFDDAKAATGWPTGTPGPHVGIALSERFANYALGGLYNSGLLCIGISTENVPQLSSGTLGLVASSSKNLGLQQESQQIAMVIRPGAPPTVTFGNGTNLGADALLNVGMKQFAIDFYIWSLDRFIRMMTATYDLTVPINLVMGKTGLAPAVGKIGVNNGLVTNSQLLREDPATLAAALGSVLSGLVGQQLGGAIKPIDINASLASTGLSLIIPDTVDGQGSPGLRKLSKGTDNFLGIFAALALAKTGPTPPPHPTLAVAQTNAEVVKKTVERAGLSVKTITPDNVPVIDIRAVSSLDDGTRAVEYSYKVDNAWWSPWTRSRNLSVRDDWMRMQGRHIIYVRSREAGRIETEDDDPAEVEVVIDTDAPRVKIALDGEGNMTVDAKDEVTEDNLVRYQINDKAWSAWIPASRLGSIDVKDAYLVNVEAQDAEGNVGTAQQELIRGRGESAAGAGCGCAVVGTEHATPRGLWILAAAIGGVAARLAQRHKKSKLGRAAKHALGGVAAMTVMSSWAGCNCGNDSQTHTTSTGSSTTSNTGGAPPACDPNVCVTLEPGLIGEYTSIAAAGSDVWVAGYSEADWDNSQTYGDLVAGKWDGDKVVWQQVDGVPTDPPVDPKAYNTAGFRGGQTEPGDDVGLWTSVAIGSDNNPAIAYFDRTHEALKFAQYDGKAWAVHTVEAKNGATIGRYAKMLFLGGNFVIAYQSIEPGGTNGAAISKVRIATSSGAKPTASGWTFEDAAVAKDTPCRLKYCATGQACVASTKLCAATATTCAPSCASGQACVGTACVDVLDKSKIDSYPDAIGDYVAMAPDGKGGFGLAYYDRTHGDLYIAAKANGKWTPLQVDGQNGDVGMGASLFIDGNGDWHVTYANGASEGVQYVKIAKGTTVGAPETVDDGLALGGKAFADGQHIVGDDSHVFVLSGGEVHVTYQDATSGTLRHAVGAPAAGAHTWTVKAATQTEFAGAFSNIVSVGGKLQLVNWWRTGGKKTAGDVRVLAVP